MDRFRQAAKKHSGCFAESAATVIKEFNEFNAAVPQLHLTVNNRLIQDRSGSFDVWFFEA